MLEDYIRARCFESVYLQWSRTIVQDVGLADVSAGRGPQQGGSEADSRAGSWR